MKSRKRDRDWIQLESEFEFGRRISVGATAHIVLMSIAVFASHLREVEPYAARIAFALTVPFTLARYVLGRIQPRMYPQRRMLWKLLAMTPIYGQALVWASLTGMVFYRHGLLSPATPILLQILAGIAAAATTALGPTPGPAIVYNAIVLGLPFGIVLLHLQDYAVFAVAVTYYLFLVFEARTQSRDYHAGLKAAVRLDEENQRLSAALRRAEMAERSEQRLQVRLAEKAKLSALGQMAAGIAHEVNNPLQIIMGATNEIEREARKNDLSGIARSLDRIRRTVERCAVIVRGLRSFGREGSADPMAFASVAAMLEEALSICRLRFKHHGIDLREILPDEDLKVECRQVQIEQVLLNLMNNAFDAVADTEHAFVEIQVVDRGDDVEISVTDSGEGIPSDNIDQVMQPFFTTKGNKGSGLGLSISLAIALDHRGELRVDPKCRNTRFVLRLPKRQEQAKKRAA